MAPGDRRSNRENPFAEPSTQGLASSGSGGRRSTPNANPFSMRSTNHVSGGGRSSSNSNPISMHNTQDGATTTSGTKKNVRKKSVNNKLTEHLRMGGARPRIEILPELTVPLGPWARSWSTEIGITVRKHVPLRYHTWKEVKTEKGLQPLFEQLLKSFDVDFIQPHVVSAVDGHLKKLYKDYRHALHRYCLALPDNIDKTQYAADDVCQEDWELLCAWWETDEYKRKSTTNKRSRSKLEVLHRGGAKSFARHRYENANPETNELPDVISHYKSMHHSLKKGWIAPRAEENYESMVEMSTQPTEEGGDPPSADSVREKVLGKRSGYAPGLGYGVLVPTSASAAATAAAAAATAATRVEMDQFRERAENAENELRVIREQQINLQRQLDIVMARLNGSSTPP